MPRAYMCDHRSPGAQQPPTHPSVCLAGHLGLMFSQSVGRSSLIDLLVNQQDAHAGWDGDGVGRWVLALEQLRMRGIVTWAGVGSSGVHQARNHGTVKYKRFALTRAK